MKKIIILFITITFLSACKNENMCVQKNKILEAKKVESKMMLANPMHEYKNAEEVAEASGLNLPKALKNITNVKFFTIGEKTAQINFSFGDENYSFRMAKGKITNLAGYYVNFESTMFCNLGKNIGYANVNYNAGKEGVISWFNEKENISYSFSTPQVTDAEEFKIIIINLMKN